MNFLGAVNRILRIEGIIRGDDDALTSFTSTQHAATIELAKIAIQTELVHLVSNDLIPYEEGVATITMTASQRLYSLASDFVRFQDTNPALVELDGSGNALSTVLTVYPGGESQLRMTYPRYREEEGDPNWFYLVGGTSKQIGLYHIPDSSGTQYRYYYEKDVSVTLETDTMPFVLEVEANIFVDAAARRFKYLFASPQVREGLFPAGLERDPVILESRSVLMDMLRGTMGSRAYGKSYG